MAALHEEAARRALREVLAEPFLSELRTALGLKRAAAERVPLDGSVPMTGPLAVGAPVQAGQAARIADLDARIKILPNGSVGVSTLPGDYPVGTSYSAVDSAAGFGNAGVVVTYRPGLDTSYMAQSFYGRTDNTFLYRGTNTTGGWGGWRTMADATSVNVVQASVTTLREDLDARIRIFPGGGFGVSTLPGDYPLGVSVAAVSGAAGFPAPGELVTHRPATDTSYISQWLFGRDDNSIHYRSSNTTGGWNVFKLIPGVGYVDAADASVRAYTDGKFARPAWLPVGNFGLVNGWTAGLHGPGVRKMYDDTRVEMRGFLTAGTLTGGTTIFTLPIGYRPAALHRFTTMYGGAFAIVDVQPTGPVQIVVSNGVAGGNLALSPIQFTADQ